MCDIIATVAWECDDKDCKARWHKASYWTAPDGYTVDNYSDGDHDDVGEDELPSADEERDSWRRYSAYVAETGDDPLGEFNVKHVVKRNEKWRFKFGETLAPGPLLVEAKHGRKHVALGCLPPHVHDYLNLQGPLKRLGDFSTWDELEAAVPGVRRHKWQVFSIEYEKPRSPNTIMAELMVLARRRLAER